MSKTHVTGRADIITVKKAKEVAKQQNRSFSNVMETALKDYVKKHHFISGNDPGDEQ